MVTGRIGELRAGGRLVAKLGPWIFEGTSAAWSIYASLAWRHPVWLTSGRPYEMRLQVGNNLWCWTVPVVVAGASVSVSGKGKPEVVRA